MCMGRTSFHESLHFLKKKAETNPYLDEDSFKGAFRAKLISKNFSVKKSGLEAVFREVREYLKKF